MIRRLALIAVLALSATALFATQASAAKQLVFCSDVSYPPEEFVQSGKPVGSDIDIAANVAKRLGMTSKIQNTGFDGIVAALLSNKCDAIISGMNDTPERRKSIAFVDYLSVGQSLIGKKGNPLGIKTPLDVCGRVAGAQVATTNLQTLQKFDKQCKAKGKKGIKIISFKEDPLGVTALKTGHLDVYESDSPPAVWYTTKDTSLQIVGKPISPLPVGIAINPKNTALKAKIQKAVNAMYKDGTMAKILKKWNMSEFALG
ncbi:MAG: ABC transporter substrate-binding protein [Actinobacteria bacterium]|nr:MAG: ABC transporter substrate-binding protein [Actinomycetota bacterium]